MVRIHQGPSLATRIFSVAGGLPVGHITRMVLAFVTLMSFAYQISTTVPVAMAQSAFEPPKLLSATTLAQGKYAATPTQLVALRNLEDLAIAATIENHNLEPGDANAVRSWGRSDATLELWAQIVAAIHTPADSRTPDQQLAVEWLSQVQKRQSDAVANSAGLEYVKWAGLDQNQYQNLVSSGASQAALTTFLSGNLHVAHPANCSYRSPAPYESEYAGWQSQYCFTPCTASAGCFPTVPSFDQLTRWGAASASPEFLTPEFVRISREVIQGAVLGGSIVAAGAVAAIIATNSALIAALSGSAFQLAVFPFAAVAWVPPTLASSLAAAGGGSVAVPATAAQAATIGGATAAAGVAAVVAIAIVAITVAVLLTINISAAAQIPSQLADTIVGARLATPDLAAMLTDTNQVGGLFNLFIGATTPLPIEDTCDNTVVGFGIRPCLNSPEIPGAEPSDPIFAIQAEGDDSPTYSPTITFQNPSIGAFFSTRLHGNWFVHTVSGEGFPSTTVQSLRLRYTDWDNVEQSAWLMYDPARGYMFASVAEFGPGDPVPTSDSCMDDGGCSYAPLIQYLGADGEHYSAMVVDPVGPRVAPTYSDNPTVGVPVTFAANGSSPLSLPVTYTWQFKSPRPSVFHCTVSGCDPFSSPIAGSEISQTFTGAGNWSVRLTATDSLGVVTTHVFTINVAGGAPPVLTLNPSSTDPTCIANETCDLRVDEVGQQMRIIGTMDHSGPDDVVEIAINWGDGTPADVASIHPSGGTLSLNLYLSTISTSRYQFEGIHQYTNPGTYIVTVTIADPGGIDQKTATYVAQSAPSIIWPAPDPIPYGTPIGDIQLSASASSLSQAGTTSVAGSFTYFLDNQQLNAGEILPVGDHEISVQFTPSDGTNFIAPDPQFRTLEVTPAPLTITAPNLSVVQGANTVPDIQAVTFDGFVNGEGRDDLVGTLSCTLTDSNDTPETLSSSLPLGAYTIACAGLTSTNYDITFEPGTLNVTDPSAPTISSTISGTQGDNGWYTSDVTVMWTITDPDSEITSTTGCDPLPITSDTPGTVVQCVANSEGGETTESITIKRDTTPPTVMFTGNHGQYGLLDTVAITCTASDTTSGVVSTTCQDIIGPATTFNRGTNRFSAVASDAAGNSGSGQTSFTIQATYQDLAVLTDRLVTNRFFARTATMMLIQAGRLDEMGNQGGARVALFVYRVVISTAARLRALSNDDAEFLLDWTSTL